MQSNNAQPYHAQGNAGSFGSPPVSPDRVQPPAGGGKRMPWWGWLLLVVLLLPVTCCGLSLFSLALLGTVTPDDGVYSDQTLPARYLNIVKEVGALEEGEEIQFLYSDALVDLRKGFYFVSDRRVVSYIQDSSVAPLKSLPFEDIEEIEFDKSESSFDNSYLTIFTKDDIVAIPLSNFSKGDERFVEAVRRGMERAKAKQAEDDPPPATSDWDS